MRVSGIVLRENFLRKLLTMKRIRCILESERNENDSEHHRRPGRIRNTGQYEEDIMGKKFFLRITRYSDRNWKSYRLPEDYEWLSGEFESLEDMIEAGAVRTEGLAGIEWPKPYFEDDDVVFPKDSPVFEVPPEEDVTVADLRSAGFIIRVYAGEKLEDLQDGVIFRPLPLTEEEAAKISEKYNIDIYPEDYERGLLSADGSIFLYRPEEVWDREDWQPRSSWL